MPPTPAERVRERLKHWLAVTNLTQRELARTVQKSQVWVKHVLHGTNEVRLRDLDIVADAMRTTASELVRADDERYQLELSPTEVRVIEKLRRDSRLYAAVCMICEIPPPPVSQTRRDKRLGS